MTQNEINEGNKLIKQFLKPNHTYHKKYVENSTGIKCRYDQLGYEHNWCMLMPVVEKIEDIVVNKESVFNVIIEQCFCEVVINHTSETIVDIDADTKIKAVYKAVLKTIKWINENK